MLEKSVKLLYNIMADYVLVAQLDRVSPSDGEGCGFDSRRVHQRVDRYVLSVNPFLILN